MNKSIVTTSFGRGEEKQTVREYVEGEIYNQDERGVAELAAANAEEAHKCLAILCQVLADRGFLTAEDIVKIADGYTQECKLVDDE